MNMISAVERCKPNRLLNCCFSYSWVERDSNPVSPYQMNLSYVSDLLMIFQYAVQEINQIQDEMETLLR